MSHSSLLMFIICSTFSWSADSKTRDFKLSWAQNSWYNPSLVVHGDRLVSSIKLTLIEKRGEKSWWINSVFICQGTSNKDLTGLSCQPYDPWTLPIALEASSSKKTTPPSPYEECEFTSQVRKGKTDVEGLGDVKVWRWPGRGVFAIFGRKPRRKGTDRYCKDVIVYHQFLAQVDNSSSSSLAAEAEAAADSGGGAAVKDGASLQSDEWDQLFSSRVLSPLPTQQPQAAAPSTGLRLGQPLPLLPPLNHSYSHLQPFTMEKNWMPFVYKGDLDATGKAQDRLFVVYSIIPHLVFELLPIIGRGGGQEDGIESVERYRNLRHKPRDRKANKDIMSKFRSFDVHGGPPMILIPAELSKSGSPYYAGIMHHIEKFDQGKVRLYRHFAFKTLATPPFSITDVSDELPLVFNATHRQRTAWVAFVNGFELNEKYKEVVVTYGAADVESRALVMSLVEFEGLFSGRQEFREVTVPYQRDRVKLRRG